jgi:acetylornithine deacetylase/succinyl-diaminopimelate desuccinylase-like protein
VNVEVLAKVDAFLQPADTAWVRQLAAWSGRAPDVAPYCTNAWAYGGLARECIILGPGSIEQAHGAQEWVATSELMKMANLLAHWWGIV